MGKKENWLKQMKRIIKSPSPDSTRKLTADVLVSPAQGKQEPINLNVNTKISAGIGIKCDNGVEDEDVADSRLPPPGKSRGENGESHALAIAKATAVATEAAAAAAQAAAEVVRLSNGRPNIGGTLEDFAAVKIQAAFRGHLAKQALRALKGLVKLQAVIRGYCVRRQARMTLRCMQTLIRLQDRVRSRQLRLTMDEHPLTVGVPPSMSPNFSGHKSKNNIVQSYSRGFQPNMQPTRKTIKYCRENNYNNDSDLRYALAQGQPAGNSPWIGKVSR